MPIVIKPRTLGLLSKCERRPPGACLIISAFAMFDLANLSSNGSFTAADDAALLSAYFDSKATAELRAAFEAMKAASLLREALWAMVSDVHLKTPGVDYQSHAREYLKRLDHFLRAA